MGYLVMVLSFGYGMLSDGIILGFDDYNGNVPDVS